MMLIPYIVLVLVALYFAKELLEWCVAIGWLLYGALGSYLLPYLLLCVCLMVVWPWYVWLPCSVLTGAYLHHRTHKGRP